MNTRLQVEHPVTEAVTGLDLVHAQIVVAAGEPLPFGQADIAVRGHAIECRIYAEDPRRLLPQSGQLLRYREPTGDGVRVDSGVIEGQSVGVHYDPMLAKLIVHGPSRAHAIAAARQALSDFQILGVTHNVGFLRTLLGHPDVAADRVHTRFIEAHLEEFAPVPSEAAIRAAAAVAAAIATGAAPSVRDAETDASIDPWDTLGPVEWLR
jgi:acetyl/propionyl-CoA carboxylase alpha subunit